jgi:prolyl-tRNA synthetase
LKWRLPAAAIEQNHDERGIIWPDAIAPFTLVICTIDYAKDAAVKTRADALYEALKARGVDVILDDRGERPGIMFAEWELIGVPHRVVISSRGLKEGTVEYQHRKETAATKMDEGALDAFLAARVK